MVDCINDSPCVLGFVSTGVEFVYDCKTIFNKALRGDVHVGDKIMRG